MITEAVEIVTSDGLRLEGELIVPGEPWAAAVLTHPHPRHGGNMRSMVPGELTAILPSAGVAVLRFNFRGMGNSEGAFDDGVGERLDVVAAIALMHEISEGLPLIVCGSSFGADTALTVDDQRIDAWCACAPPLRDEKLDNMASVAEDDRPKCLVVAERDNYRDPASVAAVTQQWRNVDLVTIGGTDHFFVGKLDVVGRTALEFIRKFRAV